MAGSQYASFDNMILHVHINVSILNCIVKYCWIEKFAPDVGTNAFT